MKTFKTLVIGALLLSLTACGSSVPVLEDPPAVSDIEAPQIGTFSDDDPVIGDDSAPLKMVLFLDFQCPYCQQIAQHIDTLTEEWIDTGKLQVQFKDFPLSRHVNSLSAHMAASAAHQQGRFLDMHHQLFETQSEWQTVDNPEEYFSQTAELLGFDMDQFARDYNDPKALSEIKDDRDTGRAWGLTGVPAFYLNGKLYQGGLTLEALETVLQKEMTNL